MWEYIASDAARDEYQALRMIGKYGTLMVDERWGVLF